MSHDSWVSRAGGVGMVAIQHAISMAKFHIPTVGTGCYFHDTEGNVAGAMQYEAGQP